MLEEMIMLLGTVGRLGIAVNELRAGKGQRPVLSQDELVKLNRMLNKALRLIGEEEARTPVPINPASAE